MTRWDLELQKELAEGWGKSKGGQEQKQARAEDAVSGTLRVSGDSPHPVCPLSGGTEAQRAQGGAAPAGALEVGGPALPRSLRRARADPLPESLPLWPEPLSRESPAQATAGGTLRAGAARGGRQGELSPHVCAVGSSCPIPGLLVANAEESNQRGARCMLVTCPPKDALSCPGAEGDTPVPPHAPPTTRSPSLFTSAQIRTLPTRSLNLDHLQEECMNVPILQVQFVTTVSHNKNQQQRKFMEL